jgi:hypothetical protein
MQQDILDYHNILSPNDKAICDLLYAEINQNLTEAEHKIWHAHPVWFLDGNPVVGYHKLKKGIRLLFWSGQTFEESALKNEGKFKAAEIYVNNISEINTTDLARWLKKAEEIQWDYKNIVKRKGFLIRLK